MLYLFKIVLLHIVQHLIWACSNFPFFYIRNCCSNVFPTCPLSIFWLNSEPCMHVKSSWRYETEIQTICVDWSILSMMLIFVKSGPWYWHVTRKISAHYYTTCLSHNMWMVTSPFWEFVSPSIVGLFLLLILPLWNSSSSSAASTKARTHTQTAHSLVVGINQGSTGQRRNQNRVWRS